MVLNSTNKPAGKHASGEERRSGSSGSVLVVSHGKDDHTPLVRAELDKLGVDVVWLDTDQYASNSNITFTVEDGVPDVAIRIGSAEHHGNAILAVFFRHIRLPRAPHIADPSARRMAESELRAALEGGLLALEPDLWMNHPEVNRRARNKLLQLRLAIQLGFRVPETCVTADPAKIRDLFQTWKGEMIAKLAGGQIIADTVESQYVVLTTQVTPHELDDLGALSACPAMYQRRIPKQHELRVSVVGDEIFACRIDSQALDTARVDWRAAGADALNCEPCTLDGAIADRCRAMMRELGLEIAGLDLIVTPEGEVVFLEINAAGQWAWVERATGLPIAAAIAKRLAQPCAHGAAVRAHTP